MSNFTDRLTDGHVAMIVRHGVFFAATAADIRRIDLSPHSIDGLIDGLHARPTNCYIADDSAVRAED